MSDTKPHEDCQKYGYGCDGPYFDPCEPCDCWKSKAKEPKR